MKPTPKTDQYVALQGRHGWYIAWVASDGTIERLPLGGGQTADRAMARAAELNAQLECHHGWKD
jgi:hypothetical protein